MRPLENLRVLDLSRVLSGPSGGKALVDLGADVIKVEPPEGDITRRAQPRRDGVAVYFSQQNCGKRCISLDLRTEEAKQIVFELAARSDVVLENFRPGVCERLGFGYERVSERNPGVIFCSVTGYGQDGPASGRRAYAPAMHAELGYVEFTARKHGIPPISDAISHADLYAGLQATVGILAALHQRTVTGEGQHVDVSMAETMLQANEWTGVEVAGGEGDRPTVFGGYNAPVLTLADGAVVCVPGDPVSTFAQWTRAMGRPELVDDPRFVDHRSRAANRTEMIAELQSWASTVPDFETFEATVGGEQLAAGRMQSVAEAAGQEWAEARGAITEVSEGVRLPSSPFRFSAADAGTHGRPAHQGAHNREVLGEILGKADEEIDALSAAGVLVEREVKDR